MNNKVILVQSPNISFPKSISSKARPGNGCKKIVVTSSFAGEGKSITCTNLAIAFVQAGYRVLVTDGVVLGPITSGTIMVVREGQTHHKDLQTSLNKLQFAETKVLGFVLNDMKRMQGGYKKYKGYKYGDSYGYSVSAIGNESLTS